MIGCCLSGSALWFNALLKKHAEEVVWSAGSIMEILSDQFGFDFRFLWVSPAQDIVYLYYFCINTVKIPDRGGG